MQMQSALCWCVQAVKKGKASMTRLGVAVSVQAWLGSHQSVKLWRASDLSPRRGGEALCSPCDPSAPVPRSRGARWVAAPAPRDVNVGKVAAAALRREALGKERVRHMRRLFMGPTVGEREDNPPTCNGAAACASSSSSCDGARRRMAPSAPHRIDWIVNMP